MRWSVAAALSCALLASSCRPSATVRRTTPVANLQSYRTVLVRVDGSPQARRFADMLEFHAIDWMRRSCAFDQIGTRRQPPLAEPDLVVDLNLQRASRGGGGLIQNPNLAVVDVTAVLSDNVDDELIGSADIRGKSSAVAVSGVNPEEQAIAAVSKTMAEILVRSGCSGERVARPEPPPPTDPVDPAIDPELLAQAEAENEAGKQLFRAADIAGAKARFEAALAIHRDPRFLFNLCLAQEALKDYAAARSSCQEVIDLQPEPRLVEKAQMRLDIIAQQS